MITRKMAGVSVCFLVLAFLALFSQCKPEAEAVELGDDTASLEASEYICSKLIPGEVLLLPPHGYALDKLNRGKKEEDFTYAVWAIDLDRYTHCEGMDYRVYRTKGVDDLMLETTHALLVDAIKGPIVLPIGSEKQKAFVKNEYTKYDDTQYTTVEQINAYLAERAAASER